MRLALGQIDTERGAAAFVAGDGYSAVMIADYRLNDREAEARSLLFGGVVGREETRTLFRCEPFSRVRNFDAHVAIVFGRAHSEGAAGGHGVESV